MAKTHEGAAGNHSGGRTLALKLKILNHYLPTMVTDCESYAQLCDKCQWHASSIHCPADQLHTTTVLYPFMRWAMDIVGPMTSSQQRCFLLVMNDYFKKWVEAEEVIQINDKEV